ncbi:hypothetical protein EDD22DRAFT_847278 [Suillus occidentalis]|nr:hypothetical protein EDD22DRAFT_847278 [Suillus occidentalis]
MIVASAPFLLIGCAFMAGGLAGIVSPLVLKYIMADYPEQYTYYGYANISQNVALMLSAVVLWIAQSGNLRIYVSNGRESYRYPMSIEVPLKDFRSAGTQASSRLKLKCFKIWEVKRTTEGNVHV